MKKNYLLLSLLFSLGTGNCTLPVTQASENLSAYMEKNTQKFIQMPDAKNYVAAYVLGYTLSIGSIIAGNRYIPPMNALRIGKLTIPIKPLINGITSYAVGYGPLLAYMYAKNKPSVLAPLLHDHISN